MFEGDVSGKRTGGRLKMIVLSLRGGADPHAPEAGWAVAGLTRSDAVL